MCFVNLEDSFQNLFTWMRCATAASILSRTVLGAARPVLCLGPSTATGSNQKESPGLLQQLHGPIQVLEDD
jgi:hypothetical protein